MCFILISEYIVVFPSNITISGKIFNFQISRAIIQDFFKGLNSIRQVLCRNSLNISTFMVTE